jgi:phage terminase large subunit-like protein
MRRIDLLRKHDEKDEFRRSTRLGLCDPQIIEDEDGKWHLHHLDFPTADHIWFVCGPDEQPFPHSYGYTKAKAITGFLSVLNLPDRLSTRLAAFCRHADQPERSKWWSWFRGQGYAVQQFSINPDHKHQVGLREMLKYELWWANEKSDGCVWCRGVTRFQNITARLALMIEAIDYYSQRPKEQERWLATMSKLWGARGRR